MPATSARVSVFIRLRSNTLIQPSLSRLPARGGVLRRNDVKIAVIGGGSTYTPELVDGLIRRSETLSLEELWLMDIAGVKVTAEARRRLAQETCCILPVIDSAQ